MKIIEDLDIDYERLRHDKKKINLCTSLFHKLKTRKCLLGKTTEQMRNLI